MRKLIISLAAAAAITAAAPALAHTAPGHAPAHAAAIMYPGGCGGCHNHG